MWVLDSPENKNRFYSLNDPLIIRSDIYIISYPWGWVQVLRSCQWHIRCYVERGFLRATYFEEGFASLVDICHENQPQNHEELCNCGGLFLLDHEFYSIQLDPIENVEGSCLKRDPQLILTVLLIKRKETGKDPVFGCKLPLQCDGASDCHI